MIQIGTCSWTEKTLLQSGEFYPKDVKTAEGRLRYYADHFLSLPLPVRGGHSLPGKNKISLDK